ncbi:uncharacterized protein YALI1_B19856g [Yarrowia lipolytica]|uniref:Uncharacterized protein n=1 Tax=Yarrowia lipolytica TaxID=4952 RepID=A0A1D8N7X8_YARLL|nr:hypothetical protein YALI1_B19856g [Yarrowia lipolytica]
MSKNYSSILYISHLQLHLCSKPPYPRSMTPEAAHATGYCVCLNGVLSGFGDSKKVPGLVHGGLVVARLSGLGIPISRTWVSQHVIYLYHRRTPSRP